MDLVTENRLARRASMLEVARQMIVNKGFEAIKVRDIADACRVSVPTLYNQFGGKDQLLALAIEEYFVDGSNPIPVTKSQCGCDRLLAVLDVATARLLEAPEYNRRLLEAFSSLESTTDVQQRIALRMTDVMLVQLQHMHEEGTLAEWADVAPLAAQITTAFISTAVIWGASAIDDETLPSAVHYATGLVLLGVVNGQTHKSLEARVRQAQATLRRVHPVSAGFVTR